MKSTDDNSSKVATGRLPDEMFSMLPKSEVELHLMAMHLIYGKNIERSYLMPLTNIYNLDYDKLTNKKVSLSNKHYLTAYSYFFYGYMVAPKYVLPLAMYILDRHPEWYRQEILDKRNLYKTDPTFWSVCISLYKNDIDAIKRQKNVFLWIDNKCDALQYAFAQDFYTPLLYSASDTQLLGLSSDYLQSKVINDELDEELLTKHIAKVKELYGGNCEDVYQSYSEMADVLRYYITAEAPTYERAPQTMWGMTGQAISLLRAGKMVEAGKAFEAALKLRNKTATVKNMFDDPIANYFLMLYYAVRNNEDTQKKVHQYLKKDIADDVHQLPAYIVANYVALHKDDEPSYYINRCLNNTDKLLQVFGHLFEEYFNVTDKHPYSGSHLKLLEGETALMSIRRKDKWELALEQLMRPFTNAAQGEKPQVRQERVAYELWGSGENIRIYPRKQKWLASGRWGSPLTLSTNNFADRRYDCMDELDNRIALSVKSYVSSSYRYYYYDEGSAPECYLPYLVGTDRVIRDVNGHHQTVTVRQEKAFLGIDRKAGKLHFSSNVSLHKDKVSAFQIIEEDKTHIAFISLTDFECQVFQTLLTLETMPAVAEEQLRQFIAVAGNNIEVHSDLIEGGSTLEKVETDSTIVLRISPVSEGFVVECRVQPLRGGKMLFFPGSGKKTIYDEREGVRYQVDRDIQTEKTRLELLNDYLAREGGFTMGEEENELTIEETLVLLEFLRQDADNNTAGEDNSAPTDYAVEWLNGAKLKLRKPRDKETYSLGLTTKQNWFEVEGELRLDEKTILSIADLLRLMRGGMVGKRYIRLNDNEFIALGDRLTKHLNSLEQLAQIDKQKVRIPQYEIGLLGELIQKSDGMLHGDNGIDRLMKRIEKAAKMTIVVPPTLQATLRDYQVEGYEWMTRLAEWGAGACLADDMGLGKTVQTIAFMLQRADKGASLVVAPASVIYNWQQELQRFAPTLNVLILNEAEDRKAMIGGAGNYDIVLTTYGLLVREEEDLAKKQWNVVCLDEAHAIKNRATKMSAAAMRLQSKARLAMTGTPLQNYLSELWNLFQFVNPGLLGSYEAFSQNFITPIEGGHNKQRQTMLRKILQPFLLRRTKAEVVDELPDKTDITRRIQLTDTERTQYEAMRIEAEQQLIQADKMDMNILASITRLRQAACSMALVDNMSVDGYGSKLDDLQELISQIVEGGNRVLVFSQFTSFLRMAEQCLTSNSVSGLTSLYLDGSTPLAKRKQMVEQFQRGEAQVFFISLKAGGLGLNLTAANYVIHLDPWWNPAIEQQATDRAYRIGQHRNVTVYHLIAADTIEEKILRLHQSKRDLADALLQDQNTTHTLTLDDMRMLVANTK